MQTGSVEIRCDVCRALAKVTLRRAKAAKVLRDEDGLSEIVGDICVGTPASSDAYPKYPGNPPLWGEMYTVKQRKGRWRMLRLPKRAPMEEKSGGGEHASVPKTGASSQQPTRKPTAPEARRLHRAALRARGAPSPRRVAAEGKAVGALAPA